MTDGSNGTDQWISSEGLHWSLMPVQWKADSRLRIPPAAATWVFVRHAVTGITPPVRIGDQLLQDEAKVHWDRRAIRRIKGVRLSPWESGILHRASVQISRQPLAGWDGK